jgi:hypothetical protein
MSDRNYDPQDECDSGPSDEEWRRRRGQRVDPATGQPIEVPEAEHFYRCRLCGTWVDCRDLGQVFDHEGELPHPVAAKH